MQKTTDIHITSNYKKHFETEKYVEYANNYIELISQFLLYTKDNVLIQNNSYYFFVIKRGIETIGHIFKILMLYTKNFPLTIYHCKKSFFYYIEFIGQIGDDNHTYLQLSSKDAMLFVLKKTIFEINNQYRQTFTLNDPQDKQFLKFFFKLIMLLNELINYCLSTKIQTGDKHAALQFCSDIPLKIIKMVYSKKKSISHAIQNIDMIIHLLNILKIKQMDSEKMLTIVKHFCKKQHKKNITIKKLSEKLSNSHFNTIYPIYSPLKIVNYIMNT